MTLCRHTCCRISHALLSWGPLETNTFISTDDAPMSLSHSCVRLHDFFYNHVSNRTLGTHSLVQWKFAEVNILRRLLLSNSSIYFTFNTSNFFPCFKILKKYIIKNSMFSAFFCPKGKSIKITSKMIAMAGDDLQVYFSY